MFSKPYNIEVGKFKTYLNIDGKSYNVFPVRYEHDEENFSKYGWLPVQTIWPYVDGKYWIKPEELEK